MFLYNLVHRFLTSSASPKWSFDFPKHACSANICIQCRAKHHAMNRAMCWWCMVRMCRVNASHDASHDVSPNIRAQSPAWCTKCFTLIVEQLCRCRRDSLLNSFCRKMFVIKCFKQGHLVTCRAVYRETSPDVRGWKHLRHLEVKSHDKEE